MEGISLSRKFRLGLVAFLAGVGLGSFFHIPSYFFIWLLPVAVIWLFVGVSKKYRVVAILTIALLLGLVRWQMHLPSLNESTLAFYNEAGTVRITGWISKEPDIRSDKIKMALSTQELEIGGEKKLVKGKVLVTLPRYPEYSYGDRLVLRGELLTPKDYDDFSYKGYLGRFGINSVMYQPKKVVLASQGEGSSIKTMLLGQKRAMVESLQRLLPRAHAGVLAAMILGVKSDIPDATKEEFARTGTSHLVAISGMHMTIISAMVAAILLGLGMRRSQALIITLGVVVVYLVIIGFPASAVRAGIMGGLLIVAFLIGRLRSSLPALLTAAAGMLLVNPMLLRYDVGFQLSFLATMGIIILLPWLEGLMKKIPNPLGLRTVLNMSLAAWAATLPLVLYNFGQVSLISPLVNILIVPLLPVVFVLGVVTATMGLLFTPVGQVVGFATWLALEYQLRVVSFFSHLPLATWEYDLPGLAVVVMLVGLGVLLWFIKKKARTGMILPG